VRAHFENCLANLFPNSKVSTCKNLSSEAIILFMDRLDSRLHLWLSGYSAADVLLPLIALHKHESIGDPVLRWMTLAVLQSAYIFGELSQRAYVLRPEDFSPRLHSILPSNLCTPVSVLEETLPWLEFNAESILEKKGKPILHLCQKLSAGLSLLVSLLQGRPIPLDALRIYFLDERDQRFSPPPADSRSFTIPAVCVDEASTDLLPSDIIEIPEISNHFSIGCVKRSVPIDESFPKDRSAWVKLVLQLDRLYHRIEESRPRFEAVIPVLLDYALDDYNLSNVFSVLSYSLIFNLSQEDKHFDSGLVEILNVLCHRASRQRRLLSKYFENCPTVCAIRIDSKRVSDRYPHVRVDARKWSMTTFLAIWFVILGFHLNLYEPHEYREAHFLVSSLSELSLVEGRHHFVSFTEVNRVSRLFLSETAPSGVLHHQPWSHLQTQENAQLVRFRNRWRCLWRPFGDHLDPDAIFAAAHKAPVPRLTPKDTGARLSSKAICRLYAAALLRLGDPTCL